MAWVIIAPARHVAETGSQIIRPLAIACAVVIVAGFPSRLLVPDKPVVRLRPAVGVLIIPEVNLDEIGFIQHLIKRLGIAADRALVVTVVAGDLKQFIVARGVVSRLIG